MESINRQKINQGVKQILKRYGKSGPGTEHVDFIIDRFFNYLILALMHGIKCGVPKTIKFQMVYSFIAEIPKTMRKQFYFSSRAFGYSFYVIAESAKMNHYGYSFKTDKALLRKIAAYNESDIIYKLIKK